MGSIRLSRFLDLDKILLSVDGSIERLFWLVKGYFASALRRKPVAGDAIGGGRWIGGRSFEKSSHLSGNIPEDPDAL